MAKTAGRPPRSESDIADFRSKIAKQALAIYRAEGFDAVSMRRLAKEVGCAPMTIYAHFAGKQDILRYLWADVLADMSNEIQGKLEQIFGPVERLQMAAPTITTTRFSKFFLFISMFLKGVQLGSYINWYACYINATLTMQVLFVTRTKLI